MKLVLDDGEVHALLGPDFELGEAEREKLPYPCDFRALRDAGFRAKRRLEARLGITWQPYVWARVVRMNSDWEAE